MSRPEDVEPISLGPRVERLLEWTRKHVPGASPILEALERETTAGGTLIAGGLAYRLFLWLLPFSLVIAAIASFWQGDLEAGGKQVGLTTSAAHTMSGVIEDSERNRWYFLARRALLPDLVLDRGRPGAQARLLRGLAHPAREVPAADSRGRGVHALRDGR